MQIVFVDTPGIHIGGHKLNKAMLNTAENAVRDEGVDCLCHIVDLSRGFGAEDSLVASIAQSSSVPRLTVFNKKDLCPQYNLRIRAFYSRFPALSDIPKVVLCSKDPSAKGVFLGALDPFIKEGPRYFDEDTLTDSDLRSLASEYIRKHLILSTREEVPHAVYIEIESYRELTARHEVHAVIHVETIGQRGIIIGKGGSLLSRIQHNASQELARLAGCPVRISCHVRVSPRWRDSSSFLRSAHLLHK